MLHLQNVDADGELAPQATNKKFLSVRREGTRDVRRQIDFYNLKALPTSKPGAKEKRGRR